MEIWIRLLLPFIVGKGKPTDLNAYLRDFCNEADILKQSGIEYGGVSYSVFVWLFICDAPARAFLKCIKGHQGYNACERCVVVGEYQGRVVFHDVDADIRTDGAFSALDYEEHQNNRSILIDYGYPCVTGFVLDYMHLVLLGVVKRCLKFLISGPLQYRLSSFQVKAVSSRLEGAMGNLPSEFVRQPRGLNEFARYKATEFRTFLLYTGLFALKDIVKKDVYEHFLCLSVAVRILLQARDMKSDMISYAKSLLKYYVSSAPSIYGKTFTSYNVHSLIHLADDVVNHNVDLNEISAFPFENYMQVLKKFVRNSKNPIAQIVKRVHELEIAGGSYSRKCIVTKVSQSNRDNCFFLMDGRYARVEEVKEGSVYVCSIVNLRYIEDYFIEPSKSTIVNICKVQSNAPMKRKCLTLADLGTKVFCYFTNNYYILIPLCHK